MSKISNLSSSEVKEQRDPIPETFASIEEAAEFWDSHSTADYEDLMHDVHFDVDIKRRTFLVSIECALAGVFSSSGLVYCIDAQSGEVVWKYETGKQIFSSPIVINGKVYIGEGLHWDEGSNLYCLNASDGGLLWAFRSSRRLQWQRTASILVVMMGEYIALIELMGR